MGCFSGKDELMHRLLSLTLIFLSYMLLGGVVFLGAKYEFEGTGLHPALATIVGVFAVSIGIWTSTVQMSSAPEVP